MPKPVLYFNFKTRPDIGDNGRVKLNYLPNGFSSADFGIVAGGGRMGVDQLFAGGNAKFDFSRMSHPEVFDLLQEVLETEGNEAIIDLEIDINNDDVIDVIGNLELSTSENNVYSLFSCNIILGEDQTKIKKNIEANVDLFSSLDIMRNSIIPIKTYDILLLSKPIFSTSVWESPEGAFSFSQGGNLSNPPFFNKVKNLTVSGIDDSLTWFEDYVDENNNVLRSNFRIIRAATTLTNVKVRIDKNLKSEWSSQPPFDNNIQIKGKIFVGTPENWYNDFMNSNNVFYDVGIGPSMVTATDDSVYEVNLGTLETGKFVFFAFYHGSQGNDIAKTTYGSTKLTVTASAVSYDTVNKGVRLIDVIKQVCLSAGLANVSFPEAEQGGFLYDQFLFNGNLLRNIIDKPFYMTFKQITEWFDELHLDYEIQNDGSIFIGSDKDFYANKEMFVTEKVVYDVFKRNFNEDFLINLFEYGYSGYQSQKENDTANTFDVVHGELQDKSPNVNSKNTLVAKPPFIRDPFALEAVRIKAFKKDENSATQDDDKKYIVDIYPRSRINSQYISTTKTDLLQHSLNLETQRLTLRNSGNFNWLLLGIKVGYSFRITSTPNPQLNQGNYTVVEVASNYLVLMPNGTFFSDIGNGERYTNFQYNIPTSSLAGITWTNQEFQLITGVQNPESFGNLRFSKTRNIISRWQSHLATSILGRQSNKPYINLLYKNNPDLITTIYGVTIKENQDFVPKNPLLNQWIYTVAFQCTFAEYFELMKKIRSSERGFIRTFDEDYNPLKLYVKDMRFKANAGTLGNVTLIGKGKHDPSVVDIDTNQSNIFISLNNGEYKVQKLIYEVKKNYFYIKDQNGRLMYGKLTFKEITFNGQPAQSKSQLINWLNQISI